MERIEKIIASATGYSRSEIKNLIKRGSVQVEGVSKVSPGLLLDDSIAKIYLDGKPLEIESGFCYYVMNKPAGYVTANKDGLSKVVMELFPQNLRKKLEPVGRLDKDTEGLLLFTDDGALNHRLMSPKHHVEKTYLALVDVKPKENAEKLFEAGMDIGDDKLTLPARLEIMDEVFFRNFLEEIREKEYFIEALKGVDTSKAAAVKVTLSEGRYHQVKRMLLKTGSRVLYLKRISLAKLTIPDGLKEGEYVKISNIGQYF